MLLLLIFLQGCKALELSAPYETAEDAVRSPASWVNAGQGNEGRISTGWIHTFRDDRLEDIVDEVLMNITRFVVKHFPPDQKVLAN